MRFAATILLFGIFWPTAAWAEPQDKVLSGASLVVQVVNGSHGGKSTQDDPVHIEIYRQNELMGTREGKVNSEGRAAFENLPLSDGDVVFAGVKHGNMMFHADPVSFHPDGNAFTANVHVFEISHDRSALSVEIHHILMKRQKDYVLINEYLRLKNSSDTAVTTQTTDDQNKPVVIDISLPKGFKNLEFGNYFEPDAVVITDRGFYDTMAIPPGQFDLSFSYRLDINAPELVIDKTVTLSTSNLIVFADLGDLRVDGLGQPDSRFTNDQKVPISYYKRNDLKANDRLTWTISGFNVNSAAEKLPSSWMIIAGAFVIVLFAAVIRLLKPRKGNKKSAERIT